MRTRYAAFAPLAAALVAAGCGGANPGTPVGGVAHATVAAKPTKLGTVLVDADDRTLYLFEKDKGTRSTCYGACASVWPPVTTSEQALAGAGIDEAKLGTTKRTDGTTEVTYAGHPLYTYAADAKAGDVKGQDVDQFGAGWYVLKPSGEKIDQ
jgi:predicted lipoprotein with Yx(FWY)xxD motif